MSRGSTLARVKRVLGDTLFHWRAAAGVYHVRRTIRPGETMTAVLMYHGLERDPERLKCNDLDVPPEACLAEIDFFVKQGYRLIAASDLSSGGEHGRGDARLVVSFDDGYLGTFEFLQHWMSRRGIPVLVAVCPRVIDESRLHWWEELQARIVAARDAVVVDLDGSPEKYVTVDGGRALNYCRSLPRTDVVRFLAQVRTQTAYLRREELLTSPHVHPNMTWDHLRQLVATGRCTVAAHSLSHDAATRMSPAELEADARECRKRIAEELDVDCVDWVYPFGSPGDLSTETEAVLRRSGYLRTYTTEERLNWGGVTQMGRFRGQGFRGSLTYYDYVWRNRHERRDALR